MPICSRSFRAKARCWAALSLLGVGLLPAAEEPAPAKVAPPPIIPLRQREDYRYLARPENRTGAWWEWFKYVPLSSGEAPPFLTFGGEIRVRYELINNTDFGSGPQDQGGYLLTRYMPYAALIVPKLPFDAEFQLVSQFEISANDYDARGPSPIDEEAFDVLQLYAQIEVPLGDGTFRVQGGRQIASFGTERLIGARYGPNIPLSFDGGLARWKDDLWEVHGFYLRPVQIDPDPLNNVSSAGQQFWGLYATRKLRDWTPFLPNAAVDFYYLGFFDDAASYNSGSGRELRHTVGTRVFGNQAFSTGVLDWNYEGILQFGTFDSNLGHGDILAWSIGTDTGYTFDTLFQPRVALKANFISGDSNAHDANLQTFNPLFPKGKYFGELTPVGPSNLINLLGAVALNLTDTLTFTAQGGPYWRYSAHDAVYGLGGNIVRSSDTGPGDTSDARFIGTQIEFVGEWHPRRELSFLVSYSQFLPGAFIQATGPAETIHFFAVEAVFQF